MKLLKIISCEGVQRSYCYYCDHDITIDGSPITEVFECFHCVVPVKYICCGTISQPIISYIHFSFEPYLIELSFENNEARLFQKREVTYGLDGLPGLLAVNFSRDMVCKLSYIPDINPANAREWLDKLLNLVAFS